MDSKKGRHQYVPGYKPNHIKNHTWRTAENSAAYLIPKLQSMAAADPNLRLLDCGAGPGTISASLAGYIPHGEVVAIDLSDEVIQRAAQHAKELGRTNMQFQTGSIYKLPFEDNTFDIVHATQVLCHLDAPLDAMKEMIRVCKPGGIVASREGDLRMWPYHPPSAWIDKSFDLFQQTMRNAGGSVDMGSRLVSVAMQAGVPRGKIEASMGTWCFSTPEDRDMWGGVMRDRLREGNMRQKALDDKLEWSAEDMDRMADAWEEWIAAEDGCLGCVNGEILISK